VFYDNFKRGLSVSSKENNLSTLMQNLNQMGDISKNLMQEIFGKDNNTN